MTEREALKLAMKALELTARDYREQRHAIAVIREALAQPEQEPCRHRIADIRNEAVESGYICIDCGALFGAYTTSPHRKPLTDEEVEKIWWEMKPYFDKHDFARAIEAAHGIKE